MITLAFFSLLVSQLLVVTARSSAANGIAGIDSTFQPISSQRHQQHDEHRIVSGSTSDVRANRIDQSAAVLNIRGGDVISGKKKTSTMKKIKEVFAQVQPATRGYLLLCLFCTLVHITGLPAPELFSLSSARIYELWRPFTAMSYFGAPSMSMANYVYFLIRYGQTVETETGSGAHAWFLLVQTALLSVLGLTLGFAFQAQAMIAAIVYICSRIRPMEKMPVQFGLVIASWQLPLVMMVIDCLSQQSASAAWPHVLGIFTGHIYHFFTKVWPALGGRARFVPPKWILKKFGEKRMSNVQGVDYRKSTSGGSSSNSGGGKMRKKSKSKGKKLGSS